MNSEPRATAWTVDELRVELDRYEEELGTEGKPRNTITSYVYPVDRFLKWLDEPYRPIRAVPRTPLTRSDGSSLSEDGTLRAGKSRYDGLRTYLLGRSEPQIRLSFAEIERIMGQPLPSSARRHRAWWANERSGSHVHAAAWMGAGRRTANVDMDAGLVDFVQ